MKGKKRYIVLLILIGIFIGIAYYTKDKRKETIKKQEEEIKKDNELIEKKSIKLTSVVTFDKNKYGILSEVGTNIFLFQKNNVYYILDNTGKELYYGSTKPTIIHDKNEKKAYYKVGNILYDSKGEVIYDKLEADDNIYTILDKDFVVVNGEEKSQIINFETKDIKNIKYFLADYNGIYVYLKNDKVYAYDNVEKEFDTLEDRDKNEVIHLKSSNEDLYLDYKKGKITQEEYYNVKLNDKYYIDYKNCGQVKSFTDNKAVVDECFYIYNKINDNFYEFVNEKDEVFLLRNDKFEKLNGFSRGYISDNYYYASKGEKDNNYYVFEENGESTELECAAYANYAGNNVFTCSDFVEPYFIKDKKISDEKYDDIFCYHDTNYCVVEKNGKKGLYYMGEKIIEPNYSDITYDKGNIIINYNDKYYVYYIEKDKTHLKKSDLNPKIEEEKYDIDVDKIVKENKLDKDLINNNKDLFIKYAFIVENNKRLGDYKKNVYNLFKVVVDNKKYLDEDLFFNKLKMLNISVKDKLDVDGAAGTYLDVNTEISILKQYSDSEKNVYHELLHFIDYCLNNNTSDKVLFYNDKIINFDDYKKLSIEEKRKVNVDSEVNSKPHFMVEAGAEIYSSYYFSNSDIISYIDASSLYYIFNYLLGEDNMKDVFYGNKNFYSLLNNSISVEKYNEFESAAREITVINGEKTNKNYTIVFDSLIDIYTNLKGKEWYNDNYFCFLLYGFANINFDKITSSKYFNTYEKIHSFYAKEHERLGRLIAKSFNETYVTNPVIYFEDNNIYLSEYYKLGNVKDTRLVTFIYNPNDKSIKEVGRYELKK